MENIDLKVFNAITKFVNCLNECFGPKQLSLQLYNTLINKTTLSHKEAITKHITLFEEFCKKNTESIVEKDSEKLEHTVIKYSDKVFIDMEYIFKEADKGEQKVIWTHILILCAYLNPSIKAKEILKEDKDSSESNFLTDVISRVEESVDGNDISNPMEAVGSIMASGVFTDLVSNMTNGLESGDLNLGSLMGTVNTMVGSLTNEMDEDDMPPGMGDMMNNLTKMMTQISEQPDDTPPS